MAERASRSLVFAEGTSNKFWNIELDGASHSVTFGRVGTAGQTQTKDFPDEAAARKAYDKLVAEKLKKGYTDSASAGTPSATPAAKPAAKNALAKGKEAALQAAATPPTPAPARPEVVISTSRSIGLDPEDWFRAGFRARQRLERGTPGPFDKEDCVRRLSKLKTATYGWDTRWDDLALPPALSREEAHFWQLAMTEPRGRDTTLAAFAEQMAKEDVTGRVDVALANELLNRFTRDLPRQVLIPLTNLLSPEEYLELMLTPRTNTQHAWYGIGRMFTLASGLSRNLLPYCTDAEVEALRKRIRRNWDPGQQPASHTDAFPPEYYAAAALGMHDEVHEVTSRWADDRYQNAQRYFDHWERPALLIFGLGSAELIESEWRRLKLKVHSPEDARGLLACTEYAALDCLANDIIAETNKEKCEALLEVLALVHAAEAAEPMLRCKLAAKAPLLARDWLDQNIGHAVPGLIETAAGRGALAEAALDYLQGLRRQGHGAVIASALDACPSREAAARVRTEVLDREEKVYEPFDAATTPGWLKKALDDAGAIKRKKLPTWATAASLPPLVVGDRRLNDEQLETVLQCILATSVATRHPLLAAVRANVERHHRDAFAWKLFQHWQSDGFPSTGKWALGAVGHVGDDGCVLKLTPLIRNWPGESQHARAVFGLECLRAVGSNVALMQLSGIAQKLKFKGLKSKAEQFVDEIAKEKGLTRSELEDRVVPDCGLDDNGRREFSFGARSFSFVLGGDLKAMVRDADGKLRTDLPKPGGKDDEALANAALDDWKLMKKQIKETATIQAGRLEGAMVTGRRWSADDFQTLLVRHPLMTHLVQKLIWGAYDKGGKLAATFRVTEERDCADVDENAFKLAPDQTIGLVHPLDLPENVRAAWGQVLGDYEIITPFPQLGRKVYSLEGDEAAQTELTRFKGIKVVAPTLIGILEKLGWVRGTAMDGGCFDEHSKQFPAADVTAVVHYEGMVSMGYIDPNETLTLETAYFCPGMRKPSGYGWDSEKKMRLGDVSPVVMSEVLSHMSVLKSKAK